MNDNSFNQWIITKYKEWSADKIGHDGSMSQFARFIKVPYEVARSWLRENGKTVRDFSHISALANIYGKEIYEILGLPIPELQEGLLFEDLPEGLAEDLFKAIFDSTQQYRMSAEEGDPLSRRELARILRESLAEYGFESTDS